MTWFEWLTNGPEPEDFRVDINTEGLYISVIGWGEYNVYKDEDLTIICTASDMIEEATYYLKSR